MLAATAAATLALFGGLALQMASGKDPALGAKAQALVAARHQRANRKVIQKTIIVRKVAPAEPAISAAASSGSVSSGYGASSGSYSAPAVSAPAPAPAPVTTSAS